MPLARYSSTSGDLVIVTLFEMNSGIGTSWTPIAQLSIPWSGTITYEFRIYNSSDSNSRTVYIQLNSSTYGPYAIPPYTSSSYTHISIDYTISSSSNVNVSMIGDADSCACYHIALKTGNADCMHKVSFIPASLYFTENYTIVV